MHNYYHIKTIVTFVVRQYLFGRNTATGFSTPFEGRMYYFKIYENDDSAINSVIILLMALLAGAIAIIIGCYFGIVALLTNNLWWVLLIIAVVAYLITYMMSWKETEVFVICGSIFSSIIIIILAVYLSITWNIAAFFIGISLEFIIVLLTKLCTANSN